ncbi:hypothetical protein CVT25_002795 [Psilocybe cyanescens]|uniref:Hypervirulence associated protein TUDOR domain-containing protein n=1 Tax=Psilocybe cyanescens TaxID=93625 RepID=A0A409WKX9_PSICY|nr:hypothetical protein CVT25_002795 [Psilocybe cyanescens]
MAIALSPRSSPRAPTSTSKSQSLAGDHVEYRAIGGKPVDGNETSTTTGKIVEVITETQPAGETEVDVKVSYLV